MEIKVTVKTNYQKFDEFRKIIEPVLKKIAISESTTVIKDVNVAPFRQYLGQDKTAFCYINTSRNAKKLTNCGYNAYKLSDKVIAILHPYAQIVPAVDVMLCDANGDTVLTERIAVIMSEGRIGGFAGVMSMQEWFDDRDFDHSKISQGAIILANDNNYYLKHFFLQPFSLSRPYHYVYKEFWSQLFFTPTVKIESSELKQVKSVKCVVVSNCPPLDEVYQKLPETLKNWNPEREK
jgi:hypothetical protein